MQSILVLIVVVALLSNASAFFLSSGKLCSVRIPSSSNLISVDFIVNTRQSRMNMMFNFGKSTPKPTEYKVNQGSAVCSIDSSIAYFLNLSSYYL